MKCYYHANRDAVGTCQTCGKALCKECASVYSPVTCEDCHVKIVAKARNDREKAKQDALINTSSEMKKAVLIGVVAGLAIAFLLGRSNYMDNGTIDWTFAILNFIAGFSLPFGWTLVSHVIPRVVGRGEEAGMWIIVIFIIKVMASVIIGIPAFIIQMVMLAVRYKRIQKM